MTLRVLAEPDKSIVAFNHNAIERNQRRRLVIRGLLAQPHIAKIVFEKLERASLLLQRPATKTEGLERIRCMSSFEQTVLDLAGADFSLLLQDNKHTLRLYQAHKMRARSRRVRIGEDGQGEPLFDVISKLISRPEYFDMSCRELWPNFIHELGERGCNPKEVAHPAEPRKDKIEYRYYKQNVDAPTRRHMSFGRFQNIITSLRKSL